MAIMIDVEEIGLVHNESLGASPQAFLGCNCYGE